MFTGVAVALVTLFDENGELLAAASADHAARLVDLGVAGVVVAGTTGEAASLSALERIELLDAVRETVGDQVPVIAGTGAPSARQAALFSEQAADHGAHAVLALSPPGTADPRRYFETVAAAAGDVAVLAYHFPAVSPPGIALDVLADLPVSGMKDSSGEPARLLDELATWDRPVYPGSAPLLPLAAGLGCRGAILALANAEPEACIAAFRPDGFDALTQLAVAHRAVRRDGIKALTAARFGTSPVTRLA